MVDTRSNMKLSDLKSKSQGRENHRNIIDCAIGAPFCPPPGSEHKKILQLYQFYIPSHINNSQEKNNEENRIMHSTKPVKISYARKTTMKTQHHSGLKISRIPCIFICTDMNNQIITNNPRLSVIVSFICAHTNNWMIKNHLSLSENDKHIIRKARLMSLSSVYIPIQSYIQRYTRTCPYIKILQEIPTHAFH